MLAQKFKYFFHFTMAIRDITQFSDGLINNDCYYLNVTIIQ